MSTTFFFSAIGGLVLTILLYIFEAFLWGITKQKVPALVAGNILFIIFTAILLYA